MGYESRFPKHRTALGADSADPPSTAQRTPEEARHHDLIHKLDIIINEVASAATLGQVQHLEELLKGHEDANAGRFDMLTAQLNDIATMVGNLAAAPLPPVPLTLWQRLRDWWSR
jgi:hypothetical protein